MDTVHMGGDQHSSPHPVVFRYSRRIMNRHAIGVGGLYGRAGPSEMTSETSLLQS